MKSNFKNMNRRVWAFVLAALMVLTTVAGSVTLPAKEAKAAEGNVFADSNFENGLPEEEPASGWWMYNDWGGSWSGVQANPYTTDDQDGLYVDFASTGWSEWGLQIFQMLTLEADTYYELSFDVESTGNKSVHVKFDNAAAALDKVFNAVEGTQTFTVNVPAIANPANPIKFLFDLGTHAGDDASVNIKISNVQMIPGEAPEPEDPAGPSNPAAPAGANLIVDGNFEALAGSDLAAGEGWWAYNAVNDGNWANCAVSTEATGNGLVLDYTGNNGGFYDAIWGLQIPQIITVEAGVPYTLSFDLTSDATKSIKAKFDGLESVLDQDVTITAADGTKTYTFENLTFAESREVKFLFAAGWMAGDDAVATVTISNVKMTAPAPDSIIVDGTFEAIATSDLAAGEGWWAYNAVNDGNWANCAVSTEATGNGLVLDYTGNNGGFYDAIWGLQIPQIITVEAGVPYTLSFDLTSDATKSIKAKFDGLESVLDQDVTITAADGTKTYTFENLTFAESGEVKFLFAAGWMAGDAAVANVTINNVQMVAADKPSTPDTPAHPPVEDPIEAPEKTVEEMAAAGYTLVWSDEFDGDSLDSSKWDYQIGNGQTASNNAGWGNQEEEYYTNSPDNVYVKDGNLYITALKQDTTDPREGTFHYTSGRIRTTSDTNGQLFATKYGRVEARMILPTEVGAWPAFWMLPQDQSIYRGWAASGEIDIMEAYGDKPYLFGGTIHYGSQWPNNVYKGKSYYFDDTTDVSVYHTYGVEWEPGKISWFVDDEVFYTADTWYSIINGNAENTTFDAPFDVPFYILLNVAVNGTWDAGEAANGDYTGNGKSSMLVDYVRVYEKDGVDYDTTSPAVPGGSGGDADAYQQYVYPLCGDNYEGYNFNQDVAFDSLKRPAAVEQTDPDWQFYVGDFGGAATCTVTDGVANVDITAAGNQTYAIQLIKHMPMLKGYNYKVSFDAYADAERDITIHPSGDADNGWAGYAAHTVTLGTAPSTYSFSFTMGNDTDPTARLEFNLGAAGIANVHISNVRFEMIEQIQVDDTVAKTPLADGNLIWNGTFDQGPNRLAYWSVSGSAEVPNYVVGRIASRDKVVRNDRTGLDENYTRRAIIDEYTEITQLGLNLKQSDQYRLTFKAYAEGVQALAAAVAGTEGMYVVESIVTTPGVEESYEVIFAMPKGVNDTDGMLIFLNMSDGEIEIDDVAMYPITDNNGEAVDYAGVVKNPVTADSDAFLINYNTAGNDPAVPNAEGAIEINTWPAANNYQSMLLHTVDMTGGIDYVLTFDAKSDLENTYEVAIQEDNSWAMIMGVQNFTTGNEWNTYTYNFTAAQSTSAANPSYLKFLLTSCQNTTTLYLKNISLTAVIPEADDGEITDAPEGTATTPAAIDEGEDLVITLAEGAWAEKFADLADTYGAVVMVGSTAFDYVELLDMLNDNTITIPADYFAFGENRIELALDGYFNIVLYVTVNELGEDPGEEPGEDPDEPGEEPEEPDQFFIDVPENAWYYSFIKEAYEAGWMDGVSATEFAPMDKMTRGELINILYQINGCPEAEAAVGYVDLDADDEYFDAISWAIENRIAKGDTARKVFMAERVITREEVAVILYNFAAAKGVDMTGRAELGAFTDAAKISAFAQEAMAWAVANRVLSGSNNRLNPRTDITKAEVAATLVKFNKAFDGILQ